MVGRTLSHYKVLEELRRGGMGIVYRALDLKLDGEIAHEARTHRTSIESEIWWKRRRPE